MRMRNADPWQDRLWISVGRPPLRVAVFVLIKKLQSLAELGKAAVGKIKEHCNPWRCTEKIASNFTENSNLLLN